MRSLLLLLLCGACLHTTAQKRTIVMPDGHSLLINIVKVDQQGRYVYTAEAQKCIMWDAKTGRQLYTFRYNGGDAVSGLAISPDGSRLAIVASGYVQLFSTTTGELITSSKVYSNYTDAAFSADGATIYAADDGVHALDGKTLIERSVVKSNIDYKARLWTLPDGRVLLVGSNQYDVFDAAITSRLSTNKLPGGADYQNFTYLPRQGYLVGWDNNAGVDFYAVATNPKRGTIKTAAYDAAVIPSQNTNEILITGPETTAGFMALDAYDTETFKLTTRYTNANIKQYHVPKTGWFDGDRKTVWLNGYNLASQYNLAVKKPVRMLEGYAASLGMDVFNPMDYRYATGKLVINTNDENLKTVDLTRMVPIQHMALKLRPDAIVASATTDTVAVFEGEKMQWRAGAKTLRPATAFKGGGVLFSGDGKTLYYNIVENAKNKTILMRLNTTTGTKQSLIEVGGFSRLNPQASGRLLAGFETMYGKNTASVWELASGKRLFAKDYTADGDYDEQYAAVSADGNRALFVRRNKFSIYDVAGGEALLSKEIRTIDKFGSAAANSDLSLFLSGTQRGELTAYNGNGVKKYEFQAHNSTIRRILFSPDDKLFYTVSYDNTIKVWEGATGRFIGTLYLFKDSNDYVFMDAAGRFDGTQEGMQKVYYLNNGKDLPLDKLFERYYTPNLFARAVAGERFAPLDDNDLRPAPKVRLSYGSITRNLEVGDDKPTYQNTTGAAEITIAADAGTDAVDEIRLFHNGKAVTLTTRNLIVADDGRTATATRKYSVTLLPGENTFRGIALNSQRTESDPDEISVVYKTASAGGAAPVNTKAVSGPVATVDKEAVLHLVVVGINAYKNPAMSLNYALADATAFKQEIEKDAKTVLGSVKTYFVTDAGADKAGITAALAQVKAGARPQDVFIFYYAGHGVINNSDKEFYLVPNDVADLKNAGAELVQKGISAKYLQGLAVDIQAQKQVFILDACQSAGAFETMLSNDGTQQKTLAMVARSTGTHWIAASGSQQFANEFSALGHGAFTYVLLQALKGSALINGMITVNGLKNYLQTGVPELMKKYNGAAQYPASFGFGSDFPLEVKK